eukprot:COSAG04_NODE_15701_length_523_cov_0.945755_2_plen_117_part_01
MRGDEDVDLEAIAAELEEGSVAESEPEAGPLDSERVVEDVDLEAMAAELKEGSAAESEPEAETEPQGELDCESASSGQDHDAVTSQAVSDDALVASPEASGIPLELDDEEGALAKAI